MPNFSIPLSGLAAESTALSAIANNLANQNTTGYKDTTVLFADLFYQNLGTTGAGDPVQLGSGTKVQEMPADFTQGNITSTGVPTDVAIQGAGFFAVQSGGVTSYTRAGDFSVDNSNFLVTSAGQQVLGYPAVNGVVNTGSGVGPLQLGAGTISPPTPTTTASITTNLNSGDAVGAIYSTPVTIYDSLGAQHTLTFSFTKTAANAWNYTLTVPPADSSLPGGVVTTGTMTFDGSGNLLTPAANLPGLSIPGLTDGAKNMTFAWDLYNAAGAPVITQVAAPDSTSSTQQNGSASGTLTDFSIGSNGTITGSFTNGNTAALGQVALASFADQQGLQLTGGTDYTQTLASGQAVIGTAGTGGRGTLSGGSLESSNVDISTEFANLIVAQRAFEADAKAVTTFDQVSQDTIALKQ
jgi:flagellar hook protein FlgE